MPAYLNRFQMITIEGPCIVLTDNLFARIASIIRRWQPQPKSHKMGYYSHGMWLIAPGTLVSQDPSGTKIRQLSDFLKGRHRVKVVWNPNWTDHEKVVLRAAARATRLKKQRYDFLGILGQLLHLPWLQSRQRAFCIEHVLSILREVDPHCPDERLSPAQLNAWLKTSPTYETRAVYDPYGD